MAAAFQGPYQDLNESEQVRTLLDDLTQALTIANQCRRNDVPVKQEFLDYIDRILDEIDQCCLQGKAAEMRACAS
jgi:hypothetical protein